MSKGKLDTKNLKELKEKTGAPIMRVKKVLEEVKGDDKKAEKILRKEGFEKAAKRSDRATAAGVVQVYQHHSGKVASVVELMCETDFVARNDLFKELAHNLSLQAASTDYKSTKEFESQEFIKDTSRKIIDLVKEVIAKTGENVRIGRVYKVELGKSEKA